MTAEREYVGLAFDSGSWGGDLTALLLHDEGDGWTLVASHVSSSETWAKHDIAKHAERLGITEYEWVGLLDRAILNSMYPPAPSENQP